jgi:hypothetical protein
MEKTTQLSVTLENQPGQLGRLCRALAHAGVNIRGITVCEASDMSTIRLVVSDPEAAMRALREAGIPYLPQDVLIVELKDEPGALERLAMRLGDCRINIQYIYGTGDAGKGEGILVLRTEDSDAARQCLVP